VDRWIEKAYLDHRKKLVRFARIVCRDLGSVVEPEDVIHEAFTRVARGLRAGTLEYRDASSFRGLLYKTIRQKAAAMSRKARRRQTGRDHDADLDSLFGPLTDPDLVSRFLTMFAEHQHQLPTKIRKAVEIAIAADFNRKALTRYRRDQLAIAFKLLKQLWNSPN
jgi:DNA-directed RNA polymerase specialized sigma24 family protein